ncbi:hypothetical protein POTOM_010353 [Populus tomentosa]|uniref:Uncharacterized protein n=1 Tax=Populus tomentosa TaxID=118781 RepID=A0A8X8DAP7_POPTO|nr:hypothetical protein POTOM_010353 [Populus tomentosa]
MSSSSAAFGPDHLSSSEQLCYVHCNFCDTVLAVSVPCTSLYKTVTVRCGHCTNLLSVSMHGLLPAANPFYLGHGFFNPQNILEEIRNGAPPNLLINQPNPNELVIPIRGVEEIPKPPMVNRREKQQCPRYLGFAFFISGLLHAIQHLFCTTTKATVDLQLIAPEKRHRVPSAYNRFIKDEIQRIKAGNPDISHREAFSAAAKNWAHFPHIHFGLMPDQPVKKANVRQQEGEDVLMKDEFFAAANVGVTPY